MKIFKLTNKTRKSFPLVLKDGSGNKVSTVIFQAGESATVLETQLTEHVAKVTKKGLFTLELLNTEPVKDKFVPVSPKVVEKNKYTYKQKGK